MDDSNVIDTEFTEIPGNDEIDLLKEMQAATEYKPEQKQIPPISQNSADHAGDFEPEPEPAPDQDDSEDSNIDASELTDIIIDGSDMLIEGVLPYLYRQTIDKEDLKTMNEIARIYKQAKKVNQKVIEFSPEQQKAMDVHIDYEDYVENLPLTTKEKKNLRKPLKKLLSSVNFKASPENTLLAVAAMIFIPRLLPIGANIFLKDKKAPEPPAP